MSIDSVSCDNEKCEVTMKNVNKTLDRIPRLTQNGSENTIPSFIKSIIKVVAIVHAFLGALKSEDKG